jgi:hypothetical protein
VPLLQHAVTRVGTAGPLPPASTLVHLFPPPTSRVALPRLLPSLGQVKTFSLQGNAVGVDVLLHSVDGRMLEPRELDLPQWFGEAAPGSSFAKSVAVRNTIKVPFAFEWSLTT